MTLEVVGVTADAQLASLGRVDPYYLFEPRRSGGELLVKTRGDFATAAASILAVVRARDPSQAVRVLALEENIGWFRGVSSLVTTLGAGLGLLALALAAVGIYAVVSYAVTRRYREIGIRMALGASAAGVLRMVLRQTLRPVAIGAVLGVAAAIVASRVLSSVLFGVSPADPFGIGGATLIVLGVAAAAGVLAARFATRTDPIAALRYE
jgi:ABC-type antimicrobial peptide transport system permease subunit